MSEIPYILGMDSVRKIILQEAERQGRSLSELSLAIGKNHAYLQQFIHRLVPKELPERLRPFLARELHLIEDLLRHNPSIPQSSKAIPRPNRVRKDTDVEWNPKTGTLPYNVPKKAPVDLIPGGRLSGERDLPVHAAAQGGKGTIIVSTDPVDWVARPEPLARVRDGYGIIISEDCMSPEFSPGDIALVHPHLPPRANDTCIFYGEHADGTVHAMIKRLRKITHDSWHLRQFNPPGDEKQDFVVKRADWQTCHVTVGKYSRR